MYQLLYISVLSFTLDIKSIKMKITDLICRKITFTHQNLNFLEIVIRLQDMTRVRDTNLRGTLIVSLEYIIRTDSEKFLLFDI